jgi:hypothetical protein
MDLQPHLVQPSGPESQGQSSKDALQSSHHHGCRNKTRKLKQHISSSYMDKYLQICLAHLQNGGTNPTNHSNRTVTPITVLSFSLAQDAHPTSQIKLGRYLKIT